MFDNNSTDGTIEYLRDEGFSEYDKAKDSKKKLYFANDTNLGGAGGFAKAVELAHQLDIDYLWIMDDDVLPEPACLEKLLAKMAEKNVEVALPSREDESYTDRVCLDIDLKSGNKFWTTLRKTFAPHPLTKDDYFVKDMTFEGPLLTLDVSKKAGLPDEGYFLFFDDTDYAQKLLKYSKIVYVTNAKLHRQLAANAKKDGADQAYTWRNYYTIRNNILFDKRHGESWAARNISPTLLMAHMLVIFKRNKHLKNNFPIVMKAWFDGIRGKNGKRVDPNY